MQDSSILWLRVAALLYFPGLIVALLSFIRHHPGRFRGALVSFLMGTTIHLVAIVEEALEVGAFPASNFFEAISLLGLVLAIVFLVCHWIYRFESLAVLIMPLVFLMALVGSAAGAHSSWQIGTMRDAWLTTHVVFIMLGYAGLLITAAVSVFYLWRERQLKEKRLPSESDAVPPLMTLDSIVARSLAWGFLSLTIGLILGIIWASNEIGTRWIVEQRILIAFVTWFIYLLLVFLRMASGWRGRKAAMLAVAALFLCGVTWVAHSGVAAVLRQ